MVATVEGIFSAHKVYFRRKYISLRVSLSPLWAKSHVFEKEMETPF